MEIKNDTTMEEAFDQLNALLDDMEQSGAFPWKRRFHLYEDGLKLIQYCSEKVDTIEKKLVILEEGGEDDSDSRIDS